jgi:ankyrin repeat protein
VQNNNSGHFFYNPQRHYDSPSKTLCSSVLMRSVSDLTISPRAASSIGAIDIAEDTEKCLSCYNSFPADSKLKHHKASSCPVLALIKSAKSDNPESRSNEPHLESGNLVIPGDQHENSHGKEVFDEAVNATTEGLSPNSLPQLETQKQYKCMCGKAYSRLDNLTLHQKIRCHETKPSSQLKLFDAVDFSVKEVISCDEKETVLIASTKSLPVPSSLNQPQSLPSSFGDQVELDHGGIYPSQHRYPTIGPGSSVSELDGQSPALLPESKTVGPRNKGLKRSRSQVSSTKSVKSTSSGSIISVRSLGQRAVSRLDRSLSHVGSVLSLTNSSRSNLLYARSIGSDQMSIADDMHLSPDEFRSWGELVEESMFNNTEAQTECEQISLRDRPCCNFNPVDRICEVCWFSGMHRAARISDNIVGLEVENAENDRFGNTVLHHAAAAGNLFQINRLLLKPALLTARNTSGETFLHVLNLNHMPPCLRLQGYIEVLKELSQSSFDFMTRDYKGVTVEEKLRLLTKDWNVDILKQQEINHLIWNSEVASTAKKTNLPSRILGLGRIKTSGLDENGDTKLIAILKTWPEQNKLLRSEKLNRLLGKHDIHMRDRRGYTALAIATRYGLRSVVKSLLEAHANPNTRSYQGTSVVAHGYVCLARAQKYGNNSLYARIMSCINLLTENGGDPEPTVLDEFGRENINRSPPKHKTKAKATKTSYDHDIKESTETYGSTYHPPPMSQSAEQARRYSLVPQSLPDYPVGIPDVLAYEHVFSVARGEDAINHNLPTISESSEEVAYVRDVRPTLQGNATSLIPQPALIYNGSGVTCFELDASWPLEQNPLSVGGTDFSSHSQQSSILQSMASCPWPSNDFMDREHDTIDPQSCFGLAFSPQEVSPKSPDNSKKHGFNDPKRRRMDIHNPQDAAPFGVIPGERLLRPPNSGAASQSYHPRKRSNALPPW